MHSFSKKNPTNETEKLIAELLDKLAKQTHKWMDKHVGKENCVVLSALQSGAANYFKSVSKSCSQNIENKSNQLDYIEMVRTDINLMLDHIKTEIKSVDLN